MKMIKQLFRQPIKTFSGLLLMTIAASILCVCVGQAIAAQATKESLNQRFSSVAIPLVQESEDLRMTADMVKLDPEIRAYLDELAKAHPDIVKGISQHGILSAYIPQMIPANITSDKYEKWNDSFVVAEVYESGGTYSVTPYGSLDASPDGMPQSCAMFVITLEEAEYYYTEEEFIYSDPNVLSWEDFESIQDYFDYLDTMERFLVTYCAYYNLVGTITQVVSLPDGGQDLVGMTARLRLKLPSEEAFAEMNLEPGQQYIVYGMDLFNLHWRLSGGLRINGEIGEIDPYDPCLLTVLTEEEKEEEFPVVAIYNKLKLNEQEYHSLNSVSMTLTGPLNVNQFERIFDENGNIVDVVPKTQITITNISGETKTISIEEYGNLYDIPSIAKLHGNVEDFLNSEEGKLWSEAIERDQINNHAFAVMGVDRLHFLETFSFGSSKIMEGRDFTQEELDCGARVCIVNAKVAAQNGLKVGDTITLNMYATDLNLPYQMNRTEGIGLVDPVASFYFGTSPFVDTAEYTIVGLWQGDRLWADLSANEYAISANTVFVPKSSVQATMETSDSVLFNTVVVENGRLDDFKELLIEAGFFGRFRYNDQGYSEIAANFHNYEELARQVLTIGAVIYGVLLLLFLLLYPGMQRNNVKTMQSIGSGFLRRFGYVLTMSMAIIIPAAALGALLGVMLWDRMVVTLQEAAMSALALELDMAVLARIAGVQMLFALVLTIFVSLIVAAPRRMSDRR